MRKLKIIINGLFNNTLNIIFLIAFAIGINSPPEPTPLVTFIAAYLIIRITLNITHNIRLDLFNAKINEKQEQQ